LGLVHSSAAENIVQLIINHLQQADEIQAKHSVISICA
jgi:hypothetical protein